MRPLIGAAINVYRKSPFHPYLGQRLAWLLTKVHRPFSRGLFPYQVGSFKMNIDLEQRIDAKIYFAGAWEPATVETIQKLVPVGGVALDVGANIGYLSLILAERVGPTGKVIAFEPTDWTYARLRANLALNDMPQITAVQAGLSDSECVCEEADIPYGYRLDGKMVTQRQAIRLITMDGYLAAHPVDRLDFIKCDTDGAEEMVFAGGIETLQRFKPAIHFELYQGVASDQVASSERLLRKLHELGYAFFREGSLEPFGSLEAVLAELQPGHHCANVVAMIPARLH